MFFKPTYVFDKVGEITPEFLQKKGIKGLILDLDNTLTTHNNPVPPKSSLDWIDIMKAAGIKLIIVSNNHAPRVTPFAEQLGLDFVSEGKKPLTFGGGRPDFHRHFRLELKGNTLDFCFSHRAGNESAVQIQESLRKTFSARGDKECALNVTAMRTESRLC